MAAAVDAPGAAEPAPDWDTVFDALRSLPATHEWTVSAAATVAAETLQQATRLATALEELEVRPPQVAPLPDGRVQLRWPAAGCRVEAEVGAGGRWLLRLVDTADAADDDAVLVEHEDVPARRALELLRQLLTAG